MNWVKISTVQGLTKQYEITLSRMLHDILQLDDVYIQWHTPLIGHWSGLYYRIWLFTLLCEVYIELCNGSGMPTEDAYSSGHLVLSHFGTYMCSYIQTNLLWTCLVSGILSYEHPSVLLFCIQYGIPYMVHPIYQGLFLLWMFYSDVGATYQ